MSKDNKKEKRLRIMCSTNAPWSTSGYGQQARQFLPKIASEGYQTSCIAFYGLEGGKILLDDVLFYPKMANTYGDDAMLHHGKDFGADVIFSLQDIWTLNENILTEMAKRGMRWIPIVPIDHEPVPPRIFNLLKLAYRVVTYAPYGTRELKRMGMHSTYIPHTIDKDNYKVHDKKAVRAEAGLPDGFIFGMVAANKDNPPRKQFDVAMDAFKMFLEKHPDSYLYLHTFPQQKGGFPINDYANHIGIKDRILTTEGYDMLTKITPELMAKIYSSFDAYLAPSQNEGFGVPIIEAQACGVPVITTGFTATKDLVKHGETGYLLNNFQKRFSALNAYVAMNDPKELYKYMEKMYKADRKAMGEAGRKFVMDNFEIDVVFEKHWKPFLEQLEHEIYDLKI